jgi:transcriptional regulator GlxA family with amidase domain
MSGAMIEPAALEVVSTRTTSPADRFEQWEHHAQATCETLQVSCDCDRFTQHFAGDPPLDRRMLVAGICRTARECLADSELNPAMLARRHSISLRSLQMLFAEHGTSPARWIRDERLHRVRADLTNPRLAHLTVAMIGERWGLVDASQISRLFRAKYGLSPSRYRKNPAAART